MCTPLLEVALPGVYGPSIWPEAPSEIKVLTASVTGSTSLIASFFLSATAMTSPNGVQPFGSLNLA